MPWCILSEKKTVIVINVFIKTLMFQTLDQVVHSENTFFSFSVLLDIKKKLKHSGSMAFEIFNIKKLLNANFSCINGFNISSGVTKGCIIWHGRPTCHHQRCNSLNHHLMQ